MRRSIASAGLLLILFLSFSQSQRSTTLEQTYPDGIDGLSVALPLGTTHASLQSFSHGSWSAWQKLSIEDEQDPTLQESNFILFPTRVTKIRLRGIVAEVHPIVVSADDIRFTVADLSGTDLPRIVPRSAWGADESLRVATNDSSSLSSSSHSARDGSLQDSETEPSDREKFCDEMQKNYPEEFRTSNTVTMSGMERLRWPLQYSPSVKLLVVHHTAQNLSDDQRSGTERMRALYQYHTVNRGWGDIGYHYVINTDGRIYEGRAGGKNVVGGHAYCNNIGTIGVALMGNFDLTTPSATQTKSLQWLLASLAETYNLDLTSQVSFHGLQRPAIIGHRDLLSTDCPGFSLYGGLPQILAHVASDHLLADVSYPKPLVARQPSTIARPRGAAHSSRGNSVAPTPDITNLASLGGNKLTLRPGQILNFSVEFTAATAFRIGSTIAKVALSDRRIGLWQERNSRLLKLRSVLGLPFALKSGETARLQLRLQAPDLPGTYTFSLGELHYALTVEGRRIPATIHRDSSPLTTQHPLPSRSEILTRPTIPPLQSSSQRSTSSSSARPLTDHAPSPTLQSDHIRVRLSFGPGPVTLTAPKGTLVGTSVSDGGPITLSADFHDCSADQSGHNLAFGTLRISAGSSALGLADAMHERRYRGVLECRIFDGALTIINEIPLEYYLAGVAEEPDTEPYEKQRAFAIAARTYAASYMQEDRRKFPGAPYDASDDPAIFQLYAGADFEDSSPQWLKAVRSTFSTVITKGGAIVRVPYFSSDDGRTRSPEDAGWKNFPFPEVFSAKDDPWCEGMENRGHGVGMSGCGAKGQAQDGKSGEEILSYYYPTTVLRRLRFSSVVEQ